MVELFRKTDKRRHQYFLSLIEEYEIESKRIHRILLIGSGESGKTTFLKQMKLLSSTTKTFSHMYRMNFLNELHLNAVISIYLIIKFMEETQIEFRNLSGEILTSKNYLYKLYEVISKRPASIENYIKKDFLNLEEKNFYDHLETLWLDENVKQTAKRGTEFNLADSAEYILNRLDDMRSVSYVPSDQDVIFCRSKTYGIHNEKITYSGINFEMIDVGGQQDERAKWIEAMSEGITAVIFLADVSAYDRNLLENSRINRLRDSISLLNQVWKKTPLAEKSIILFLNKQDRLESRIRDNTCTFVQHFPECKEGSITFLYNFLKQLSMALVYKKNEKEIWNRVFGYFLISYTADEKKRKEEYRMVKDLITKWMDENIKLIKHCIDEKSSVYLPDTLEFEDLRGQLESNYFYKTVCTSNIIEMLFLENCKQTEKRRIFTYPTTAVDQRNVMHVFNSCKAILRGEAMSEVNRMIAED